MWKKTLSPETGGICGKGRKDTTTPKIKEKYAHITGIQHKPTKWIPHIQSKVKKWIGSFLGSLFMPTHIMALPTQGLTEFPTVHMYPSIFTPFRQNEGQEKLRTYHAICDAWNDCMNP